jgi:Sec-independent protein secretion pathway component TatC
VRYEWWPVVRLLVAGSAVVVAASLLPPLPLVASILSHTLLVALYVMAIFTLPILSPDDERMVRTSVGNVLLRLRRRPHALDGTALSGHGP